MKLEHFDPSTPIGAVVYAIVFASGAYLVSRILSRGLTTLAHVDTGRVVDDASRRFIIQLIHLITFTVAVILYVHLIPALRVMGTALLAGASVASVVLGLAAQNTLGNLVAGVSLLLYRPFQGGDRLHVFTPMGSEVGTVEQVTLGYTVLVTFDNRRIVIPNSTMANSVTINLTTTDPRVMATISIMIGYDANIEKARAVLMELARSHEHVAEVVSCPVVSLGTSGVVLNLRAWCADAATAKVFEFDLYEQAKNAFDREGIEIPYAYTNVIIRRERQS